MEELVVSSIPSSFVYKDLKLKEVKGAGEAKLFIGPLAKKEEFRKFFEFNSLYRYKLDKQNMLDYLHEVKFEYHYQMFFKYSNVNLDEWNLKLEMIKALKEEDLYLNLVEQTDDSRYYIAQKPREDVKEDKMTMKNVLRKIVLPKISNIVFKKDIINKVIYLTLDFRLQDYKPNFLIF